MFKFTLHFLLLLLIVCNLAKALFEINLDSVNSKIKNDSNFINIDKVRVRKVNRTHHLVVGEGILYVPMDNSYLIGCLLYQKAGNDYKLMPYKIQSKPFCDAARGSFLFMPDIIKVSNMPPQDTVKELSFVIQMEVN